ncbi:MAG: hypothetical protein M3Q64_02755, partial [bacterium]|nr:hypothetical protein [bacterium]
MACNRFGHPIHQGPRGAVKDLVEISAEKYNLIFPEVNMVGQLSESDPIYGLTIERQNQRTFDVLQHVAQKVELGRIIYVGQSLGGLAVAQLVQCGIEVGSQHVILWGPPT